MSGFAPFGILWLYYEHQANQSISLYNATIENATIADILELTRANEQPYTYPVMVILLMMLVFSATSNTTLLDATALAISKKHDADFARQKLWGTNYHSYFFIQKLTLHFGTIRLCRYGSITNHMWSHCGTDITLFR